MSKVLRIKRKAINRIWAFNFENKRLYEILLRSLNPKWIQSQTDVVIELRFNQRRDEWKNKMLYLFVFESNQWNHRTTQSINKS